MMTNKEAINLLRGLEQSLDGYCELNDEGKKAFNMAVSALELFGNTEQLPSAQPEPMPGKWISGSMYCRAWECSKCGYRVDLEDGGIYNFCAACGEKKG